MSMIYDITNSLEANPGPVLSNLKPWECTYTENGHNSKVKVASCVQQFNSLSWEGCSQRSA